MARLAFLSKEWVEEARKIRAEYRGKAPAVPLSIRMNQVITEVPFGDGIIHAYLDTSSGEFDMETGHLDRPDLTITLDYPTAKAILIEGDAQAAMQAFLGGRVKVDGDVTKLTIDHSIDRPDAKVIKAVSGGWPNADAPSGTSLTSWPEAASRWKIPSTDL